MSNINTGGPAFPMSGFGTRHGQPVQAIYQQGMTLRDYFAAKAMQGLYANPELKAEWKIQEITAYAYQVADAMLKARQP